MDRLWALSRSATLAEAFQNTPKPTAKSNPDLLAKLNRLAFVGPAGNQQHLQDLVRNVLPMVREGFQTSPTPATFLTDISGYIDATTSGTPATFKTSNTTTTNSQIDQLNLFYDSISTAYNTLLAQIRTTIWSSIVEFQTIVGNVGSLVTLDATEKTVNEYTETSIKDLPVVDLANTWNTYSTAKNTYLAKADSILADKVSEYNDLMAKYNVFRNTPIIQGIDQASSAASMDAYTLPTGSTESVSLATIQSTSYANAATYFGDKGFLEQLRTFVSSELVDWEIEYNAAYQVLNKPQYSYTRPVNIATMTPKQLVSTMNDFLGVSDAPTAAVGGNLVDEYNARNSKALQLKNAINEESESYVRTNDIGALETRYAQLLTDIRSALWAKIKTFQTIVGNVGSVYSTLTSDQTIVNQYTETGINGMNYEGLKAAWDLYSTQNPLFIASANAALATKQTDYDRLYRSYVRFQTSKNVTDIQTPATLTTSDVPSLDSLKANSYATVATFFQTGGQLDTLLAFVRDELISWENAYVAKYNALTAEVKAQFQYRDVTDDEIRAMESQQLIDLMNSFGGFGAIDAEGPVSAPTGFLTQLSTGNLLVDALLSIRKFQLFYTTNLVLVKSNAEYRVGNLGILLDEITSPTFIGTTLATTDNTALTTIKTRYDQGFVELYAEVLKKLEAVKSSYNNLQLFSAFAKDTTDFSALAVPNDANVAAIVGHRERYLQSSILKIVTATQDNLKAVFQKNSALLDADIPNKPTLPTFSFNTLSAPDFVSLPSTYTTEEYTSYVTESIPRAQALLQRTSDVFITLKEQRNFRNRLLAETLKWMHTKMLEAGIDDGSADDIVKNIPATWPLSPSVADILAEDTKYTDALDSYTTAMNTHVSENMKAFTNLTTNYKDFRKQAMRLDAEGNPAPSTNIRTTSRIDDLAEIPSDLQASGSLTDLSGTALQNAIVSIGLQYGADGTQTGTGLLPRLIKFTKDELSDYVQKYNARYSEIAAQTQTLAPSTASADLVTLGAIDLTAADLIRIMSSYVTVTTGLMDAVDRDATLDAMAEFYKALLHNNNLMSNATFRDGVIAKAFQLYSTRFADITTDLLSVTLHQMVGADVAADSQAILAATLSAQDLQNRYTKYTKAMEELYKGLRTDLSTLQDNMKTLHASYSSFYSSYDATFFQAFKETAEWSTLPTYPAMSATIPPAEFSTANLATLESKSDDILLTGVAAGIVPAVKSGLAAFVNVLEASVGAGKPVAFEGQPDLDSYLTSEMRTIIGATLPTITRPVATEIGKEDNTALATFLTECQTHMAVLLSLDTIVGALGEYMIALKSAYKGVVQTQIIGFFAGYDKDMREVLKEPGPAIDPALAATNVCVKPSGNQATVGCANTTVSSDGEALGTSSSIQEITAVQPGYPFVDYVATSTAGISYLHTTSQKYTALQQAFTALRTKLLGVKAIRPIAIGIVQSYYNLYDQYKTDIDVVKGTVEYKAFAADVSGLKIYMPSVTNKNYTSVTDAFNNLSQTEITGFFYPYGAAVVEPARAEGAKYRALLTLLANAVENIILTFESARNSEENAAFLEARYASLSADMQDISYTVGHKTELASATITLDRIKEIYDLYKGSGGYLAKLDTALSAGQQSTQKRAAAIAAMNTFKSVYTNFQTSAFQNHEPSAIALLKKIDDATSTPYFSGGMTTHAFKSLSDEELDTLAAEYAAATPVTTTGSVDYSKQTGIVGDVKKAAEAIFTQFKTDYDASNTLWALPLVLDSTTSFIPNSFKSVSTMVAADIRDVKAATTDVAIKQLLDKYLSVDAQGLTLQLPSVVQDVQALKAARETAETAIQRYCTWFATFGDLLKDYTSKELTFIATYYQQSGSAFSVTEAFNRLSVGNTEDTLNLDKTPTLEGITTYFAADGVGIGAIVGDIGKLIAAMIDQYSSTFSGQSDLFSSALATTGRLIAPSAAKYASAPGVFTQISQDKQSVASAVTARSSTDLLAIYAKYGDTGYQAELSALIGELQTGKSAREAARDALAAYYNLYSPFVGTGNILNNVTNNRWDILNSYIEMKKDGSIDVTDAFYDLTNTMLTNIYETYTELTEGYSIPEKFSLTADYMTPDPRMDQVYALLHFHMLNLIKTVNNNYNTNQTLFELSGAKIDPSLIEATFRQTIATDVDTLNEADKDALLVLQEKYKGLKTLIATTAGPLTITNELRPKVVAAAMSYYTLYNTFNNTLVFTSQLVDLSALQAIYKLNDSQSAVYRETNNVALECARQKYVNTLKAHDPASTVVICTDTTVSSDFAAKTNAYTRLVLSCKDLMIAKINALVKYYNDNKTDIEELGVQSLDMRIQYIVYNRPGSTTEPAADIATINGTAIEKLEAILLEMMEKYYTGENSIKVLLERAKNGGSELGVARSNVLASINAFRGEYNKYNTSGCIFDPMNKRNSGQNYTSYISNNAMTYIAKMAPGTSASSDGVYSWGTTSPYGQTTYFRNLTVSALQSEKTAIDALLVAGSGSYLASIKTALAKAIDDFVALKTANSTLFAEVLPTWNVATIYPTLNASTAADKETINSITSLPSESLIELQAKYLNGSGALFATLDSAIADAKQEKAKVLALKELNAARDSCRTAMVDLKNLFETYTVLVSQRPSALLTVESYLTFENNTTQDTPAFLDLDAAAVKAFETTVKAAYTELLSSIASEMTSVLTSFKNLRQQYRDFYEDNKDAYGAVPLDAKFNVFVSDSVVADADTIHSAFTTFYPLYLELMIFVQAQLTGSVDTNTSAILQRYNERYQFYYAPAPSGPRIRASPPSVYTAYSADLATARGPISASQLASMLSSYDTRYDELRLTDKRWAATEAIKTYLDYIAQYGDLTTTEKTTTRYKDVATYIYTNPADAGKPDYPFRPAFMGFSATEYATIERTYRNAITQFAAALLGSVEPVLNDFFKVWSQYVQVRGTPGISLAHEDLMADVYDTYAGNRSTLIDAILQNKDVKGLSGQQLFLRIKEFIAAAKILFQTQQYKNCIQRDLQLRKPTITPETAFKKIVLDKSENMFTAALGAAAFQDYKGHTSQLQLPKQTQQGTTQQGTSRWSFF